MTKLRQDSSSSGTQDDGAEMSHQLYVEHLRQRLAQSDVLRSQVFDLERDVVFLRGELQRQRKSLETAERVRLMAVERCGVRHVDKEQYLKARRRAKQLEREIRQLRKSRSYRVGRALSRAFRQLVPVDAAGGTPSPDTTSPQRKTEVAGRGAPTAVIPASSPARSTVPDRVSPPIVPPNLASVILLDCRGSDSQQIAAATAQIGELADGGVAVVVLDTLDFRTARQYGMRIEYIPDETTLADAVGSERARSIVRQRWDEIVAQHRPTEVYRSGATDAEGTSRAELAWFSTTEQFR